jgi:demethylmenaquinone methyltransferase / 2-methoxy-6-polyprenyl-1,4-benzoquinol methylase
MSFRLPSTEEKAGYVYDQFERIARRYDLTNDLISFGMHRGWKAEAIQNLKLKAGGSYLDVCCGTGDLALFMASKLPENSKVTGVDFSPGMLEVAKDRLLRRKESNPSKGAASLELIQADAQNLPFGDNTFDGAIISFGLRNLTDFGKGISEMARVVRPGGMVINLDLGRPSPPFSWMFNIFFGKVVPIIGSIIQGDRKAYTYLPESRSIYPAPDGISKLFHEAGLEKVTYKPLAIGSVALHTGQVP